MHSDREIEKAKYVEAYKDPRYKMGDARFGQAKFEIFQLQPRSSLLDVGCGRGEILDFAAALGFKTMQGLEAVPELTERPDVMLGDCTALPFAGKSFDHVTMFDVVEHLLPGDDEKALRELCRVARKTVLFTIANNVSVRNGVELHINLKPFSTWNLLIREWLGGQATLHPYRPHPRFPNALWKLTLNP